MTAILQVAARAGAAMADEPRLIPCEMGQDAFWERLQRSSDVPLCAMLCVTERCPMACAHCYQNERSRTARAAELSLAEIEDLLDQLAAFGVFRLSITGGEPTLRRDLLEIVEAAWKRKFLISLKTSGAFLEGEQIERLRESGLATMSVSLYHADAARHDRFVGIDGAFEKTVRSLTTFGELGGIAIASTVIMDWNSGAIGRLKQLCQDRGWSFVADAKVLLADDGGRNAEHVRAAGDDQVGAMKHLPNASQRRAAPDPDGPLCLAGVSSIYVKPDGRVWTCPALPITLGNIRETPLARIWSESEALARIHRLRWGDNDECMACEHNRFCQRCPGEAYKEHGDPNRAATVDCAVARAFERIWAGENGDDQA